jgi:DNA-binding transcriptional LysR family regulator
VDLNLRLVRCLIAVLDEGHFGRAASKLYISGPALSQHVRKLEKQLRLTLIDRDSHPVRVTEQGAGFAEAARALLAANDHAVALATASRRRQEGLFTIGFVLTFAGPLTQAILDGFAEAVPGLTVNLVELGFGEQLEAVGNGIVDASFLRGPVRPDRRVRVEPVLTEPRALAVSVRNPLAGRTAINIVDVGPQPQIRFEDPSLDPSWARWWAADPRPDGSRPRYGPAIRTISEFLALVAADRGVGITTPSVGSQFARPDIVYLPINDIPPSESLLCTRADDRSPAVDHLRRIVHAAAEPGG